MLDVVTYIQRQLDPTLAYRFACRVGMCGSCAMTVNGERALDLPHARREGGARRRARDRAARATCRSCATWSPTCASSSTNGRARRASSGPTRRATTISRASRRHPPQRAAVDAGDRMHRLRRLLRVLRRRGLESRVSRAGGAEPRVDAGQRRARRRPARAPRRGRRRRRLPRLPYAQLLHRALPEAHRADGVDRGAQARDARARRCAASCERRPRVGDERRLLARAARERGGARAVRAGASGDDDRTRCAAA